MGYRYLKNSCPEGGAADIPIYPGLGVCAFLHFLGMEDQ